MKLFEQSLSGLEIITGELNELIIEALLDDYYTGLTYASSIEPLMGKLLSKIISQTCILVQNGATIISPSEKAQLAVIMVMQLLRGKQSREYMQKLYCSFLDNTKGAIEMCVVANATNLSAPEGGLHYYPAGYQDLPNILRPVEVGGKLTRSGVMEVCAPNYPDKGVSAPVPNAFRAGMYVVMRTDERPMMKDAVIKAWYPMDSTKQYSAYMFPVHGIGLELGLTPAVMSILRKPTGACKYFSTDVVSITKKDLQPGEILDGEGGFCAHGEFFTAEESLKLGAVPMGLSGSMKIIKPLKQGQVITWNDVEFDNQNEAIILRREMEELFRKEKNI